MKIRNIRLLVVQRLSHVVEKPLLSRSVCSRVLEPIEYLKEKESMNFDVLVENEVLGQIDRYDVIILSKPTSNMARQIVSVSRDRKIATIADLDDFLPGFPAYSKADVKAEKLENFKKIGAEATLVTTATPRTKTHLDPYLNRKTKLVRNGINIERHRKFLSHERPNRFIFTNADLLKVSHFKDDFFGVINSFLDRHPNLALDIFSDPNPEISRFNRYADRGTVEWFEHKKLLAAAGYIFGIVPLGGLEDADALLFNSCKSPIKFLEYGALEIPAIYSKSPIYEDVIEHGKTGHLVENTAAAWVDALELFVRDAAYRKKISISAFLDIQEKHGIENAANDWIDAIEMAADSR